ncbi:YceI family protein [Aeoliella sp. ICT_H6.2]|uniref:YceI family protein n=1 Tax=Aeoliella straminimaris TaxID=2954799 RepID=A0A9X2JJJ5_9BACT|nr:YceI family protein [Aeoliella straminimaris]MCO6045059.1 YceI family protein [Aeoliella straminimaris]
MPTHKLTAFAPLVVLCAIASIPLAIAQAPATKDKESSKKLTPVPVEADTAKISGKNTCIEFVGLHTGDDPKPRLGGFKKFDGVLLVEQGALKKISVKIEMASIWTEFDKLTTHLQAADFFNVEEYPTATFKSTKITPADNKGKVKVTGLLNMHGTDGEITFPATVKVTDKGITLTSEFKLDRTAFGMTDHADGVEAMVNVEVKVGQATKGVEEDEKEKNPAKEDTKSAQIERPRSGLAVGESVEPWTPVHVAGPDKGTKACPVCNYLAQPAIVIFAKDGANTTQLVEEVESLVAKHNEQGLKAFVAVLDTAPENVESMANQSGIVLTSVCYPDTKTGKKDLAAYHVDPNVENTVMIYKQYKVVANWVNLPSEDAGQLRKAVEEMVN